jgi:ABC-type transport system involved in cytochrome c biogenesis permease subunit
MIAQLLRDLRDLLVSLKLTVVLIVFSCVLILAATLDQVNLGIWAVQEKYFRTFVVYWQTGNLNLALFPGGYTIGGLLIINLIGAHFYRFQWTWKKSGIWLAHAGLIILLVGELLTGLWQDDYYLRLDEGETKNYSESHRLVELAVTDTSGPDTDTVVALPEKLLESRAPLQHPKLPFQITVKTYFPNSSLHMGSPAAGAAPVEATQGVGPRIIATQQPPTYKSDTRNLPSAYVELSGVDGPIGTWLVSTMLDDPQPFTYGGRTWQLTLRFARHYQPYSLTLLKFSHDRYAGTEIPKNFSSRIRLTTPDGRDDREVLIYMNNPLRYSGLTFYQAGFENNDRTSILQVVRNPSWLMPYIACSLMTLGLLIQFGIHLFGFFTRRRTAALTAAKTTAVASPRPGGVYPLVVLGLAAAAVLYTLLPPRFRSDYDLAGFGHLPTLVNGRIKPLDTVARTSLLVLQGRQRVKAPDGRNLHPTEWLLDVIYRPEIANSYQHFEIVHPDVLALLNLTTEDGAGKKRFSFTQFAKGLEELERQAKFADAVEPAIRNSFQKAVVQLRNNIILFQRLQSSLVAPGMDGYLEKLAQFDTLFKAGLAAANAQKTGSPQDMAAVRPLLDLSVSFATLESVGYLLLMPPETGKASPAGWRNTGAALNESLTRGRLDPAAASYVRIGLAWRNYQPAEFNRLVQEYRAGLDREIPGLMRKCDTESRFNSSQPFYTSTVLYVVAFLVGVFSWLKWPGALGRTAFWLTALAWLLATAGIVARMWLEGRPPVTNLYSSALFVGWGAVALCLVLEVIYKNAIGSVAAGLIGFGTLLIAHHLALGGDTLEMMRAVLDSNFWLATHVVTVTVGYSATYLAGFLALIYVVRGVFTKSLDQATTDALSRMVYGIICFATFFSFVGTVLGGIWADQSWGRFWGWDPKENGALIIVLWNALILHARWGGLVKARGLMNLAIFSNIVTSWSWFGVNMLGVGLHSYGFMDSAFWWLLMFAGSQLAFIAIAALPLAKWRSPMVAPPVT